MEVCAVVTTILTCACAPDIRGFLASKRPHLKNPRRGLEKLENKIKELTGQEHEVLQNLELYRIRHGREPNHMVNTWLSNVRRIGSEVETLAPRAKDEKKCMCGLLPNYCSRLTIGKEISDKFAEASQLCINGGQFNDFGAITRNPNDQGQTLPAEETHSGSTTTSYIKEIWSYVMDNSVGIIGVHGMGGIGKTFLMKNVNNQLKQGKDFDCVHWVSASRDFNLERLQKAIAASIGLELTDADEDHVRRAAKLNDALIWKKRVVLILDNMWQPFTLEDIGIPRVKNGCKLVITTRKFSVCQDMVTDKEVEIKPLPTDEAWRMFKELVGMSVWSLPTNTQTMMMDVARECAGLPLAICTVARALRKVNSDIKWQNALAALRSPDGNILNMDEKVFAALRLSYDYLKEDTTKSCFLYCALFPEGHLIETKELIEYWIWEGLFGDSEMIKDYTRRGETVFGDLVDASLLEGTCDQHERVTHVKMHDMVRDMARRISPQCLIEAGAGLTKPPYEGKWTKDVEKISLMRNDLKQLPLQPMCPNLSYLLLQYNSFTENISQSFFTHLITNLKVLDLSFTGISSLPESLSLLVNLRALLLQNCYKLVFLPSLARLIELRVLDLSCTLIRELPHGIEMLTNLRRLNLSHTQLEMTSYGLFSKYSRLEHLLMGGWGLVWGSILMNGFEGAVVEELQGAINLRVLNATFRDMRVFNIYVTEHAENLQLESFQLCVGQPHEGCDISPSEFGQKSVTISTFQMEENYIVLPADTIELCITVYFLEEPAPLCICNALHLKKCRINRSSYGPHIIADEDDSLSSLETLELKFLDNLIKLFPENPRVGTLESLEILHVGHCNSMNYLLSPRWLMHLTKLKEIYVEDCDAMEEIISGVEPEDDQVNGNLKIPNLTKLHLARLTNLSSIFNGILGRHSLRSIEVSGCLKLKRLPSFVTAPRDLIVIKGEREWWEKLNWDHAPGAQSFFLPMLVGYDQAESSTANDPDTAWSSTSTKSWSLT